MADTERQSCPVPPENIVRNAFYKTNISILLTAVAMLIVPLVGAVILLNVTGSNPIGYIAAVFLVGFPAYLIFVPRRPKLEAFPSRPTVDARALEKERGYYGRLEFGPNSREVVDFLVYLSTLSQEHWRYAENIKRGMQSSSASQILGLLRRQESQGVHRGAVTRRANAEAALHESILRLKKTSAANVSPSVVDAVTIAGLALIYRDVLPASAFNRDYGPFAPIMPVDILAGTSER